MSGARIHPPSSFKLKELRRRGIVPRSDLLTFGAVFVSVGAVLAVLAPAAIATLSAALVDALHAPDANDSASLMGQFRSSLARWSPSFGWLWVIAPAAAVVASVAQVGVAAATGRRAARFERAGHGGDGARLRGVLAPALRGAIVFAIAVGAAIAVWGMQAPVAALWRDPFALASAFGRGTMAFGLLLVVVGMIDLVYVRYSYFHSHRMTQAERDEELRQTRGQGATIRRSVETQ